MAYIVEYTTLSGKRIPILHKIFETAESAEAFGEQGVSSGNYRDYTVVEQDDKETLEKIAYHERMNARHVAFANQAHAAGKTELRDQHKEAAKQHRRAALDYEIGSPRAAERSLDANTMSGLIIEAAPKMKGDWLKAQREKDRAHADAMGRHVKSGRKKSYTSTQRSLAQLRGEELPEAFGNPEPSADKSGYPANIDSLQAVKRQIEAGRMDLVDALINSMIGRLMHDNNTEESVAEGYKELPKMDTERYGERAGLEGPFQTMAGKVVYYDPKEGAYYDPDTDMYMSYDEFKALDNDRTGMREAAGDGNYARIIYDYSDNWGSIDIYKNHEKVDAWDDYFGANETGNPLAAKFVEMAEANGLDPMTLEVVDENGDIGKFDGKKFTWNVKENEEIVKFNGKKFTSYKRFNSEAKANAFLEKNEAYGVIGEKDGYVYVAKNTDLGENKTVNEISKDTARSYYKKAAKDIANKATSADDYRSGSGNLKSRLNRNYNRDGSRTTDADREKDKETISKYDAARKSAERKIKNRATGMSRAASRMESIELDEAAAKIACVKCDEVSTAAAWKKNNGFCPKCKTSSQGVAESINEDISAEAHHMERDHEVQMARSDLYKTANYAIKLHSILKGISEEQGLEGWMQAKITKASDYLSSVFHALEYDELERSQSEPIPAAESAERPYVAVHVKKGTTEVTGSSSYDAAKKAAAKWGLKSTAGVDVYLADIKHTPTESVDEGMTASQHRQKMIDKIKKSGAVKSGSMSKDEEKVDETTTAGAIATAPMPMSKMIKRKKK